MRYIYTLEFFDLTSTNISEDEVADSDAGEFKCDDVFPNELEYAVGYYEGGREFRVYRNPTALHTNN